MKPTRSLTRVSTVLAAAACTLAAEATFVPPPSRPGESAWIELRHQRQERNLCVPTSASMILELFGDRISPRELKALSRHRETEGSRP